MSRFLPTSALSRLNRRAGSKRATEVAPLLRRALVLADRARRVTGGAFDPRIVLALEAAGERAEVPLPRIRASTGAWLHVGRSGEVSLSAPVDLGGLGKGLALRLAAKRLRGFRSMAGFLLDAGGDLVAHGCPDDGPSWRVGIEDPIRPDGTVVGLQVTGMAVATSSIAVRRWGTPADAAHHLIDPRTDRPAVTGLVSVTVAASDPLWAEVWTKALFLAGAPAIRAAADDRRLAAWWIRDDGRVGASARTADLEVFRHRGLT